MNWICFHFHFQNVMSLKTPFKKLKHTKCIQLAFITGQLYKMTLVETCAFFWSFNDIEDIYIYWNHFKYLGDKMCDIKCETNWTNEMNSIKTERFNGVYGKL